MDSLQEQVTSLSVKVDALHQMIERLSEKTSEVLSGAKLNGGYETHRSYVESGASHYSFIGRSSYDAAMEHKDVLSDTNYPDTDSQSGERTLAPEIQIQRLTAQLTAAYNRIAALEEQLLSRRVH